MHKKLEDLRAEFDKVKSAVEDIHNRATTESRDLSEQEDVDVNTLLARADELKPLIEAEVNKVNKLNDVAAVFARVNGTTETRAQKEEESKLNAREYLFHYVRAHALGSQAQDSQRALAVASSSSAAGLLPYTIQGDIIKFAYTQRKTIESLRYFPVPDGNQFYRRVFTSGASVQAQGSENTEVASGIPSVSYVTVPHSTYAGGARFTLQALNFTDPTLFDVTMQDIADQYAIRTNTVVASALRTAATTVQPLANSGATGGSVVRAIMTAADTVFNNCKREADTIWVSLAVKTWLASLADSTGRPIFPSIGAQNTMGTQDNISALNAGLSIGGLRVVVDPHFASETFIVGCSQFGEVYESMYPTLQAWVPSTLGQEVAVAGELGTYFRSEGFVRLLDSDGNSAATPNFG